MPGKHIRGDEAADKADHGADADGDTEGHNFMIDPSSSRVLANQRSKEVERAAKARQREKEARGR